MGPVLHRNWFARRSRSAVWCGAILSLVVTARAHAAVYNILDLGTLSGASFGQGINASGQVVGNSNSHGFRTAAGAPINPATDNVGTLGGTNSTAYGINASGQVVGASTTAAGQSHAYRTAANAQITAASDLGTLGGNSSAAAAINASGQVAGYFSLAGNVTFHAFRTTAGGNIAADSDLGTLGGNSFAAAINASGQVAGESATLPGPTHAFRTTATGNIVVATSDLGTIGGSYSGAYGLNDAGQIAGYSATSADAATHAVRTAANAKITAASDLGTLSGTNSYAYAINNFGQTVGYSDTLTIGLSHAFFVDVTGGMQDLNNLIPTGTGWVLNDAIAINDAAQIAGYGSIGGQTHAFLLTPVPEPGGLVLLVCGGLPSLTRRRRIR